MPLSPPKSRQHLHTRGIDLKGYYREDGLFDLEARIVDTKTYTYEAPRTGLVGSGHPVHDMSIRLGVDHTLTVREVEAVMNVQPYGACSDVLGNFQNLVGLQMGPGWNKRVRQVIGGVLGCTHIGDLLGPLATVAFQTMGGDYVMDLMAKHRSTEEPIDAEEAMPLMLNGCHAWDISGEIVKEDYPQYYQAPETEVIKILDGGTRTRS
jgi:DUF2889 family protein